MSVPVEELLSEAVLHVAGRGLLLDPSLQQHLLVNLPLLLLLLQVLLHTKTLAIILLILLRGVTKLTIEHKSIDREWNTTWTLFLFSLCTVHSEGRAMWTLMDGGTILHIQNLIFTHPQHTVKHV